MKPLLPFLLALCLGACSTVPPPLPRVALPAVAPVKRATATTKDSTAAAASKAEAARQAVDAAIVEAHLNGLAKNEADRQAHAELVLKALTEAKRRVEAAAEAAQLADTRAALAVQEADRLSEAQAKAAIRTQAIEDQNDQLRADQIAMHKWHGLGAVWWGLKHFVLYCAMWIAGFAIIFGVLAYSIPPLGIAVLGFLRRIGHVFRPPK